MREEQLAVAVTSWLRLSLDPGELIVSLDLKHGADVAAGERAFEDEMHWLRTLPVSNRELRTAKNKLLTAYARGMRTNSGKADWLGTYEVFFGDYRKLFSVPREIERVTSSEVQRVAQRYFSPANRTVATLKPVPASRSRESEP